MKKVKKILVSIVVSILLSITILSSLPVHAADEQKSAITKEYDETSKYSKAYQEYLKLSDEEKAKLKVIPRKYDIPLDSIYEDTIEVKEEASLFNLFGLFAKSTIVTADAETIPSSFDLRDVIEVPVRNQLDEGLCWAFASMKSLETNLALHGYGNYDFSEWHVGLLESEMFGGTGTTQSGGNFFNFEDYVARNHGPVLEEEVPYQKQYSVEEYDYLMNLEQKAYVEEVEELPTIDKKNEIYTDEELQLFRNKVKKNIMENGSLFAVILAENFKIIKNDTTLYTKETDQYTNHAVSIIGWDDNYSRYNFKSKNGSIPSKDGAYICMNSWGENWGDNGIFYVSYEDIYIEINISGVKKSSIHPVYEEIKFNDINLYNAIKEELGNIVLDSNYMEKTLKISKIAKEYIKQMDELNLSNKNISDLTGIEVFENLQVLDLSRNNVSDITLLSNMKNLWMLNLEHNNITDASPLSGLTETSQFYLGYNNITNFEFAKNLKDLYVLNLKYNNITDVSNLLFESEFSIKLDLSGNKNLYGIKNLKNMFFLCLNDCGLDDSIIPILSNLDVMGYELKNNNITNVSELDKLGNISLYLSGNKNIDISYIPSNVDFLDLSNCNISDVSALMQNFYGYELDLSNNPIDNSQIQYLKTSNYLINLNLSYTNVTDVSDLKNITSLFLDGNKNLTGIEKLTQLKILSMNDCELSNVDNLIYLTELQNVYLDDNKIDNIDCLGNFKNLCNISINNNLITDVSVINSLDKLRELYANNNKIEIIGNEVFKKTVSAENQIVELNTTAQINKDNRFELPEIIRTLYERRYTEKGKIEIEFYNCLMDYKENKVIINPKSYSENNAYIKIKNGKFAGTIFEINYNVVSQITPSELIITQNEDTHNEYIEGQEFDCSRIKVEVLYDNGAVETINDYTVLNGENLQLGQENIIIKYKNLEMDCNIVVIAEKDTVEINFKDNKMYEWIEYTINNDVKIYYKDPVTLKMIVNKEDVESCHMLDKNNQEGITDLTGLEKFVNLTSFAIKGADFKDVSILKELKEIDYIEIIDNINLTDISSFENCENLCMLFLKNTGVTDIEFLKKLNSLEDISIFKSKIKDIGELIELNRLEYIVIESIFNEDELEKNYNNQIILPQFIKETYASNQFAPQDTAVRMYMLNQAGERESDNFYNVPLKTDSEGNLVIELDKEITENKTNEKREIEVTLTNQSYFYELTCTIQYSTEEINDEIVIDTETYNVINEENLPYVSYDNEVAQRLGKTYTISNPTIYTKETLKKAISSKIGITIEEFVNELHTNANKITIYDADGTKVAEVEMDGNGIATQVNMLKTGKTASLVKTGQTIKIEKGTEQLTYDIIVKGDVNGDGMLTTIDSTKIKQILANSQLAIEKEKAAADVNPDGIMTTNDSTIIKKILAGIK